MGLLDVLAVEPDHPDAVAMRRTMYVDLSALYPEMTAEVEARGGFAWMESRRTGTWCDVLVAYLDGRPAGHIGSRASALPGYGPGQVEEVRALVVEPTVRRAGVARTLHAALAARARDRGVRALALETGERQVAAVTLYQSLGYRDVASFAPHEADPTSVFLALDL